MGQDTDNFLQDNRATQTKSSSLDTIDRLLQNEGLRSRKRNNQNRDSQELAMLKDISTPIEEKTEGSLS